MAHYQKLEQRADALANRKQLWASAPVNEETTADQDIVEETEAVRHAHLHSHACRPSQRHS